ncbi:PREDICTED: uncharacterized protein LOC108780382 [Cyphomyrmex costatus]|uniref:uncharacterized protein LOC108780382 n=1 Tax=Cyphomyrmex costatus TaxID=456900 RepID=UPI00085222EE|nr:PREDICTED: uncharacterized protein LOC108780382 [Cyphomyrmex costatus]
MQTLRPQMSPGRTPSPMDYNPSLVQQSYQPNNVTPIIQQQQPNMLNVQFFNESPLSDQSQLNQQELNLLLNKVTPENQGGLQPLNNIDTAGASCLLDMDSQQYNLNWNSSDFVDFGNLTANLSSGLFISDSIQPEANNAEERNMNERISWINVNQELSVLDNKILATNRENDG